MMATTMAVDDNDNKVDGNSAMGNDDGDGATGDEVDKDGDAMGVGATGYNDDYDGNGGRQ